jgi:hypothetical protein
MQRQLQHEPASSHADRRHKKRGQSPLETRKHVSISDLAGRSTVKKVQPRGMGHSLGESSRKEADNSEGSSSSRGNSHSQKKGMKQKRYKTCNIPDIKCMQNRNKMLVMEE